MVYNFIRMDNSLINWNGLHKEKESHIKTRIAFVMSETNEKNMQRDSFILCMNVRITKFLSMNRNSSLMVLQETLFLSKLLTFHNYQGHFKFYSLWKLHL